MKLLILLACLMLLGCKTLPPTNLVVPPMPPKIKSTRSMTKALTEPAPAVTNLTLRWVNCADQPPGAWYRVYERFSLSEPWRLYRELTNTWSITIPATNAQAFYKFSVTDGREEGFGRTNCP